MEGKEYTRDLQEREGERDEGGGSQRKDRFLLTKTKLVIHAERITRFHWFLWKVE